jgi:hypothetical protein
MPADYETTLCVGEVMQGLISSLASEAFLLNIDWCSMQSTRRLAYELS